MVKRTRIGLLSFGLLMLGLSVNIAAQDIGRAFWTGWASMPQTRCIQRAKVSLRLAKLRLKRSDSWFVEGEGKGVNVVIKCIAEDNSNRLVNPTVVRMLVDVDVAGRGVTEAESRRLNFLRNCIKQFVLTGKSTCWEIGGGATNSSFSMRVSAAQNWQTTRVMVNVGDQIRIVAKGSVQYTPRKTAPNGGRCGPQGVPGFESFSINRKWNHCALIAAIGKQSLLVGQAVTFRAQQKGVLYFRVNDKDIGNNSGEFIATVTIQRRLK